MTILKKIQIILSRFFNSANSSKSANILEKQKSDITQNMGHCKRCYKFTTLDNLGYCDNCATLKKYIETIIKVEHRMERDTDDLYNVVREANTFSFSKLDVENAEVVENLSGVEKSFLAYLNAKNVDKIEVAGYWIYEHFIDCNYLISKFIKNGYLEISEHKNLEYLTIEELKNILKLFNLKLSGTKPVLIQRIKENINEEQLNQLIVKKKRIFNLTQKSNDILNNQIAIIANDVDFEYQCFNLILNNKLQEAYTLICNYENNKIAKRGIGCNWSNDEYKMLNLHIDSELPFRIPQCLEKYEKELKSTAIYARMMGANPTKAVSFFNNHFKIRCDKRIINEILVTLCIYAIKPNLSEENIDKINNIEEEIKRIDNISQSVFAELSIDKFIETLQQKIQILGFDLDELKITQYKDGTYNFTYGECQIGRIYFGQKSSTMQILTLNDVIWLKNETFEKYIENIDKWIEYLQEIRK